MATKDIKNQLQEILQRNKLELPKYETIQMPNVKEINFLSTVRVLDQQFQAVNSRKKDAEKSSAEKAYNYLKENHKELFETLFEGELKILKEFDVKNHDYRNVNNIVCLDGENVDIPQDDLTKYADKLFLIFVSKNTTKKKCFRVENKNANVYLFVAQTTISDSADHLLTFKLGQLSMVLVNREIRFTVISKDHFVECLDFFSEKIKHQCNFKDILQ